MTSWWYEAAAATLARAWLPRTNARARAAARGPIAEERHVRRARSLRGVRRPFGLAADRGLLGTATGRIACRPRVPMQRRARGRRSGRAGVEGDHRSHLRRRHEGARSALCVCEASKGRRREDHSYRRGRRGGTRSIRRDARCDVRRRFRGRRCGARARVRQARDGKHGAHEGRRLRAALGRSDSARLREPSLKLEGAYTFAVSSSSLPLVSGNRARMIASASIGNTAVTLTARLHELWSAANPTAIGART